MASTTQRLLAISTRINHRLPQFFLVGVVGVAVNTCALWISVRVIGLALPLAGICAAVVSTFSNFLLNDAFTWRDRRAPTLRVKTIRLGRYYATTGLGNLVYLGVLTTLTRWFGFQVLLANVAAIGAGGSLNFLLHNRWTWPQADHNAES
jgi:putative flippase GtrA